MGFPPRRYCLQALRVGGRVHLEQDTRVLRILHKSQARVIYGLVKTLASIHSLTSNERMNTQSRQPDSLMTSCMPVQSPWPDPDPRFSSSSAFGVSRPSRPVRPCNCRAAPHVCAGMQSSLIDELRGTWRQDLPPAASYVAQIPRTKRWGFLPVGTAYRPSQLEICTATPPEKAVP